MTIRERARRFLDERTNGLDTSTKTATIGIMEMFAEQETAELRKENEKLQQEVDRLLLSKNDINNAKDMKTSNREIRRLNTIYLNLLNGLLGKDGLTIVRSER